MAKRKADRFRRIRAAGEIGKHKGYIYALDVLDGNINAPKYVKKQIKKIVEIAEGKNKKYIISASKVELVDNLLKELIMPIGYAAGKSMYDCLAGFQLFFIISVLGTVHKDNPKKRKYKKAVLEICRKNGKTLLVAIIFILTMLTEPRFSKLYSVAPDGALSREVKEVMMMIIKSSPNLFDEDNPDLVFKLRRDYTKCNLTDVTYYPLNYSKNRLDGKLPTVFVADEVGALPTNYAIEAMESGQITIENNLGFVISTKYPTIDNPFEGEVNYAKEVLDDLKEDEGLFALLYEPDNIKNWEKDDSVLEQSNPLALELLEVMEDLKTKRIRAIAMPSARENFLTKHCNVIYQGVGTETYVDVEMVRKCKVKDPINWTNRRVYVGLDLAQTTDNVSYTMLSLDEDTGKILAESKAFIPEDKIELKTMEENVDYRLHINKGDCFACGNQVVDYGFIERIIMMIEDKHKVSVVGIGYDRYNALSSAQKFEEAGYTTVEVKQHSSVLHPATKLLLEYILEQKFAYNENLLYEINFQNAKCAYDTNMNMYVHKKKSTGKVDMVISTLIALVLLMENEILSEGEAWSVMEA